MRHCPSAWARVSVCLIGALLALAVPAAATPEYTQTFTLQPGWSSIYLEVQPADRAVESVLGNAACGGQAASIASVWTYDTRYGRVGVPLDPAEGLLNATGWFVHYHSSRPESVISTLFGMSANRAYLIRNDGASPIVCSVAGEPLLQPYEWTADAFTLTGLHVDPDNSPSFGAFFGPSAAHTGQAVFRLDPSGFWEPVQSFFEPVQDGEAYWIYTSGASTYQGPLVVGINARNRLEFARRLDRAHLELQNNLDVDTAIRFGTASGSLPLIYREVNDSGRDEWLPLSVGFSVDAPASTAVNFTIGPDRSGIADRAEQVLEINNGLGTRLLVSVGASVAQSTSPTTLDPLSLRAAAGGTSTVVGGVNDFARNDPRPSGSSGVPTHACAGLWVGVALIDAVNEIRCEPEYSSCAFVPAGSTCSLSGATCVSDGDCVGPVALGSPFTGPCVPAFDRSPFDDNVCAEQGVDPGSCGASCACDCDRVCSTTAVPDPDPTPTPRSFPLRLIVHVDRDGNAVLLKEVIQLFRKPMMEPDAEQPGFSQAVDSGEYVLVTDEDLIPQYDGVVLRDGKPVGVRISTVSYDYPNEDQPPSLGTMPIVGQLTTTFELPANHPTNPFLHRYHPDHDNKDAQFNDLESVCTITGENCSTDADCVGPVDQGSLPTGPCVERTEAPTITRTITLDLEEDFPPLFGGRVVKPPGWGSDVVGGRYTEIIEGVLLENLAASGTVLLQRVATEDELNPEPAP